MARRKRENAQDAARWDIAAWAETTPSRPAVTREQIVRLALVLLDEAGYDGLTMRRLAERLGVQAASLYNHVLNKGQLLALIADAICAEVPDITPGNDWRSDLESVASGYRRALQTHRDGARVLAATPPFGPQRLRLMEQVVDVICRAGFADEDAVNATFVINTYVVGFVLDESLGLPDGDNSDAEARAQGERGFRSLPSSRYPRLVALSHLLFQPSSDRRFAFGLTALLDGFERQLARGRAGGSAADITKSGRELPAGLGGQAQT